MVSSARTAGWDTPARCATTRRAGPSASSASTSPRTARASETSQARTSTGTSTDATRSSTSGFGVALRETSTIRSAPRSASHRATCRPRAPCPPVTRAVPLVVKVSGDARCGAGCRRRDEDPAGAQRELVLAVRAGHAATRRCASRPRPRVEVDDAAEGAPGARARRRGRGRAAATGRRRPGRRRRCCAPAGDQPDGGLLVRGRTGREKLERRPRRPRWARTAGVGAMGRDDHRGAERGELAGCGDAPVDTELVEHRGDACARGAVGADQRPRAGAEVLERREGSDRLPLLVVRRRRTADGRPGTSTVPEEIVVRPATASSQKRRRWKR